MTRLKYFTISELCRSQMAVAFKISNVLPDDLFPRAMLTLAGLERVRAFLGHPMPITSGYRCPELNAAVGGARDSQHLQAEAVDFTCPGYGDIRSVASALARARYILGIDQLILEPNWIHMSFTIDPRGQVLTKQGSKYVQGIV